MAGLGAHKVCQLLFKGLDLLAEIEGLFNPFDGMIPEGVGFRHEGMGHDWCGDGKWKWMDLELERWWNPPHYSGF